MYKCELIKSQLKPVGSDAAHPGSALVEARQRGWRENSTACGRNAAAGTTVLTWDRTGVIGEVLTLTTAAGR